MILDHHRHDALIESELARRDPDPPIRGRDARVEAARDLLVGHGLGRERQRRQRRPARHGPVVWPVGDAPGGVAEPSPWFAVDRGHLVARTIAGGQAPAVLVVAGAFAGIAFGILALDVGRAPAVLEVVGAHLPHEAIPDTAEVDPGCLLYTSPSPRD